MTAATPEPDEASGGRRGWLPFAALILGVLVATVILLLVLTSTRASRSYDFFVLKTEQGALQEEVQALTRDIAELESLHRLEAAAREAGLVPAGTPAYVRLADGSIDGTAHPAQQPPPVPQWRGHPGDARWSPEQETTQQRRGAAGRAGGQGAAASGDSPASGGQADDQSEATGPSAGAGD